MPINYPDIREAELLTPGPRRLFLGAYGFEDRSMGWPDRQANQQGVIDKALFFRYRRPKGKNKISILRRCLQSMGAARLPDLGLDPQHVHGLQDALREHLFSDPVDEVVLDISAMTKLLILICLCALADFGGRVRIVYTEALTYAPSEEEYRALEGSAELIARFPSRGFESIVRVKCLSSIRMQGQPVTLVAFTSFNEQLVRHMLGTLNPHRLIFIGSRPPTAGYKWRERATQDIHAKVLEEYSEDNPRGPDGLLLRSTSTLDYRETKYEMDELCARYGAYERIICAATGSKMQTVGLFFAKMAHPDVHIEYPTPDSYYVSGLSEGVKRVHEILIPHFSKLLKDSRLLSPTAELD
ncbi:MAG TPA: hypothetical protein VI756_15850 [Blastocatellia bacterium]